MGTQRWQAAEAGSICPHSKLMLLGCTTCTHPLRKAQQLSGANGPGFTAEAPQLRTTSSRLRDGLSINIAPEGKNCCRMREACWRASSRVRHDCSSCTSSLRSEEHTSELQSLRHLVCRLL